MPTPIHFILCQTFMRTFPFIFFLFVIACGSTPEQPPLTEDERIERDSVVALIERADPASLDRAFELLDDEPYIVLERLEQFTADGQVSAVRERTLTIDGESALVLNSSASGMFDFGSFGRFVSLDDLDHIPDNPVPFLIDDDPPYLTPVGEEVYRFSFGADTTLGDLHVRTLVIQALPDAQFPLRNMTLYIDPSDSHLVGLRVHRESDSFFFGENSRMSLFLSQDRLPAQATYDVEIHGALTATRRFRLSRTYGGVNDVNVAELAE